MRKEAIKKMQEQAGQSFSYALRAGDYREPWRIFRIMAEFVEGYQFLSALKNEITFLGSARIKEGHEYYQIARSLAGLLAKKNFTVITGGGPGIMEAANRGAHEAGGQSIGLNIQLPFEQIINPYVTRSTSFFYFFNLKVMLTSPACAFVYFPGGYGTMDEFFEVVDLMELGLMNKCPVVLVGRKYWSPLIDFLVNRSCIIGSVPGDHVQAWKVVDSAEEAFEQLKDVEDTGVAGQFDACTFNNEANVDWKIFRIMAELVEGFEFVTGIKNAVTVLGTKGTTSDSPYYQSAYRLGELLAKKNFAVITGGQKGTAEAANRGAFEHGGVSIGIGMQVGDKPRLNAYLTKSINFKFPFTRKLIVTTPTRAFVFYPGGFGTLHQLFEVLTLIQTKKMTMVPVILVNHNFWEPLHSYIKKMMVHE
ncbi:MAG: TIGR00730 family Rossman fold protein, partial [Patescibacteria group bacterium]